MARTTVLAYNVIKASLFVVCCLIASFFKDHVREIPTKLDLQIMLLFVIYFASLIMI